MKKLFICLLAITLLNGCTSSSLTNSRDQSAVSNIENTNKAELNLNAFKDTTNPQVKKSTTGICHEIGSTYYSRTKNFTPYNSIDDCLNSGGRLPLR